MSVEIVSSPDSDLTQVRELVLHREPGAETRARALLAAAERTAAHARLLAALAACSRDVAAARPELMEAIAAARALPELEPPAQLDLALALLVVDEPTEAVDVVLAALPKGGADDVSPTLLMAFIDQLISDDRRAETEALLRTIYARLVTPGDARLLSRVTGPTRRAPFRRRRFLEEALRLVDNRLEQGANPTLLTVRAGILVGLGRLAEAAGTVKTVLSQRPGDTLARTLLVETLSQQHDYDGAVFELEQLPEAQRTAPEAVATQVDLLVQKGSPQQAVDVAEEAVTEGVDDRTVRAAHVRALLAAGRVAEARDRLAELAEGGEGRTDLALLDAEILEAEGDVAGAARRLQELTERGVDDATTHATLGRLLQRDDQPAEALEHYQRALEIDPGLGDVVVRRAALLLELDRAVEALEVIETGDGEDVQVARLRGDVLAQLGRADEALGWYRHAFAGADADERPALVERLEAVCEDLLSGDAAAELLATLDALDEAGVPRSATSLGIRAEALRQRQHIRAAARAAEQAIAGGKTDVWLAGTYAASLAELSRSAAALRALEPAFAQIPTYVFGRSVEAVALSNLGRPTAAIAVLDQHFESESAPGWATWVGVSRAQCLIDLWRLDEARRRLEDMLLEWPQDVTVHGVLGSVYSRQEQTERALASLRQAADLVGGDVGPSTAVELADAATAAAGRRTDEATEMYRRAIGATAADIADEPPLPLRRVTGAWARLRLGDPGAAATELRGAIAEAEDPMPIAGLSLAVAATLMGQPAEADIALSDAVRALRGLPERECAAAVAADAAYRLGLLLADPEWAGQRAALADLRARLSGAGVPGVAV